MTAVSVKRQSGLAIFSKASPISNDTLHPIVEEWMRRQSHPMRARTRGFRAEKVAPMNNSMLKAILVVAGSVLAALLVAGVAVGWAVDAVLVATPLIMLTVAATGHNSKDAQSVAPLNPVRQHRPE